MVPTWEETLLTEAEVSVEWFGVRDWKSGTALRNWAAKTNAVSIYIVGSGVLQVTANGALWKVPAGEALFIPQGMLRESLIVPCDTHWYSLGLNIRGRGQLDLTHFLHGMHQWSPSANISSWLQILADTWTTSAGHQLAQNRLPPDIAAVMIGNGLAKAILGTCWNTLRSYGSSGADRAIPRWLWDALECIHDNPNITLGELSEKAMVSPATLRRSFHRYLHRSPQQYLIEQRLLLAKNYLETREENVLTIAGMVGFESLSHFTRLFAERFGNTPARYRRHCRTGKI